MRSDQIDFGWCIQGPPWGSPPFFLLTNSVRERRKESQAYIGEAWAKPGETPARGWRRAYRIGWRCIRVTIRPFGGGHG